MKLDPTVMRTMNATDFRVLEAVEKGMKDHSIVPMPLITSIASLRNGGTNKVVSSLLRDKLLSHECKKGSYDGYRLTNAGYDILALYSLKVRGYVAALGQRIGTGKESDVYLAVSPEGRQVVLKFHRLGRTSFRNVRKKRDYFRGSASQQHQQAHSWLFLSRLSALKEYAFMKALYDVKYPTPTPVAHSRHIVAMSLVRGLPLYQIYPKQLSVDQAADIYQQATYLASRLAQHGLVHCDLNEFNLLVDLSGIQAQATSDFEDPYVRHSGLTVTGEKSLGALSKPAWEQSLEASDNILEQLPEPVERLENGEAKPIVTLIDFPQMISIKHPNAQEYYERDLACLRRFFEQKLQCHIPDDADDNITWDAIVAKNILDSTSANETQERLDGLLRASGFSDNMGKEIELYYFDNGPAPIGSSVVEESDDSRSSSNSSNSKKNEVICEHEYTSAIRTDETIVPVHKNLIELDSMEKVSSEREGTVNIIDGEMDDLLDEDQIRSLTRDQLTEQAKLRVRRQIEAQRKKSTKQGAFRTRNSNKNYIKGKRILADTGL